MSGGSIDWGDFKRKMRLFHAESAKITAEKFGDVVLEASGYRGTNAIKLGVFKLEEKMVENRPTYKKPGEKQFLFYTKNGWWQVGPDTSKALGSWHNLDKAMTPDAITKTWQVFKRGAYPMVSTAKITRVDIGRLVGLEKARFDGDVVLFREDGVTAQHAGLLGVFELQEEVVQGRPTYKKPGEKVFLFYSTSGQWLVGDDTSKAVGYWMATSAARTPSAITEPWMVHNGSAWVKVVAAKIIETKKLKQEVARRESVKALWAAAAAQMRDDVPKGLLVKKAVRKAAESKAAAHEALLAAADAAAAAVVVAESKAAAAAAAKKKKS
jgi:hypothetical protein